MKLVRILMAKLVHRQNGRMSSLQACGSLMRRLATIFKPAFNLDESSMRYTTRMPPKSKAVVSMLTSQPVPLIASASSGVRLLNLVVCLKLCLINVHLRVPRLAFGIPLGTDS